MSDELLDEVEAINSIYGDGSLVQTEDESSSTYILKLPGDASWLRIRFPEAYPAQPPLILGTHHSSGGVRGAGARDLRLFKDAVHSVFQEGSVCLFDAVEEFGRRVEERPPEEPRDGPEHEEAAAGEEEEQEDPFPAPDWTLSEVVVENKSTFVARVARASSPGRRGATSRVCWRRTRRCGWRRTISRRGGYAANGARSSRTAMTTGRRRRAVGCCT
ncbi:hypothetical protein J3459_002547 [Metarhizium acridum]|nr:hypothetical protein J3459_002547 [Metarhizium acridum]